MKLEVSASARHMMATAVALTATLLASPAALAATINVPTDQPTIAAAVGVALPGDVIQVAGTHVESLASVINVNQPNLQILGAPGSTINVTANTIAIAVYASGVTIDGLTMTSATPWSAAFVQITANNCTISHTTIYGPPQPLPMSGWVVNRALVVSPSYTGLQVLNNTWHTMRSGAYLDHNTGLVSGNLVYNTKGGFLGDGATVTYTGNSWGPLATANEWDIVIFPSTLPGNYPDMVALSNANNGGTCWDQRLASSSRTPVYVDAAAAPGGIGSPRLPYQTIQAGIAQVYVGGTVNVADGTYAESLDVYKSMTLNGTSRVGTFIDAMGDFNFVFQHFTLKGHPTNSASYGLKITGDAATAIVDDVRVFNSRRSAIDLNGVNSGTISNVWGEGAAFGVGLALTNCTNFTLSNIHTTGNAWAGVAFYTNTGPYTPGTNNITLLAGGNSFGEAVPLYTEPHPSVPLGTINISTSEFGYLVGSSTQPYHRFYFGSEAAGFATIVAGGVANGWLQNRVSGVYAVDPTQAPGMHFAPALAVAAPNATIDFRAGVVEEQVVIAQAGITIDGAGMGTSIIRSPVSVPSYFTLSGVDNHPVVFVNGVQDVVVRDLTVDGFGRAAGNYRFWGVAFWNGDGKLLNSRVTGVRENPYNGAQHGSGLYVNHGVAGTYDVEIGNCTIDDFQKNGTAFGGTGTTVDLHDSVITGQGPTAIIAQNCVQYAAGAAGSIARCSVSNSVYTPNSVTSTGILLFGAGTMTLTDLNGANGVDNCQTGIYALDTNATIDGLDISTSVAAPESYGVYFYNTSASFNGPGSTGTPGEHARRVQAMDYASLEEHGGTPLLTAMSGSVTNACMDGFDVPFSTGISAYSAGGPLTVTATYDKVRNFDYGCWVGGTGAVLTANNNEIASNLTAGYDNTFTGAAQNAEQNWWGDAAGPAGAGDDVLGPNVDYTPWRISGASATPCAFTPTFNNQVGPVAPSGCISIANSCVAVPFTIARTDNAPLRGFSATFQLGGGLTLCGANIVFGSYLIGGTHYEIVNNGGGSYTVDGTTLGSPCGTTTPTGTLFTAYVTAPGVGTGTVTMTNLLLRDCDNAPIAATMGAPISITIDNVAPVAVANLASAQKKTGNDSNGTTKIQLTFTAPGDAATTEVYRKGYGQYPEYDDCAGSGVPTLPTYVTLGAQGWTLTGVTATGQYDEPATRDFWYYVVFTKDACGNVSSVSNLAGGTLNYHLGDVSDGVTPGAGDNLVNAVDISLLGAHYGITLSPTCGAAFNYLDVGPTTDFSVNARPTTDNKVNFEDLIMFAINYGTVSFNGPSSNGDLAGSGARGEQPKLALAFDPQTPAGMMNGTLTARLNLIDNVSATKGIHGVVAFDRARLELVNSTEGTWLAQQNPFWKAIADEKGIAIDAAALGNGVTLHGSGEVAVLTFRVKQAGARPTLATSDLRDADNRFLADRPAGADLAQDLTSSREATVTTALDVLTARPNPFQGTTEIAFSLAAAGPVELRIYDAGGRAVRTLLHGAMGAGSHALVWDGRTDDGIKVGPGVYFSALRTQDRELSRKLLLVR